MLYLTFQGVTMISILRQLRPCTDLTSDTGYHLNTDLLLQYAGHWDLRHAEGSKSHVARGWDHGPKSRPSDKGIKYFISKNKLKGFKVYLQDPQIMKQYLRQCSHLVLHRGILYRWVTLSKEYQNALQLVIPQIYQRKVLQGCHDDIGQMGLEQMLDLLSGWFYLPREARNVELHIHRHDQWTSLKSRPQKVAMENIWATHHLQLVHLVYLKIEVT